ncbi:MAG: hypothetical protein L6V84_06930 [Oscillospiraceae bacterium]|nr:MAG: hypothetical protein L6V84_06930 [Oscillospiraceae bacterium]
MAVGHDRLRLVCRDFLGGRLYDLALGSVVRILDLIGKTGTLVLTAPLTQLLQKLFLEKNFSKDHIGSRQRGKRSEKQWRRPSARCTSSFSSSRTGTWYILLLSFLQVCVRDACTPAYTPAIGTARGEIPLIRSYYRPH